MIRRFLRLLLIFSLLSPGVLSAPSQQAQGQQEQPGEAKPDPPLDQLFTPREMQEYRAHPQYKERMEVFTDALKRYAQTLRGEVEKKNINQVLLILDTLQSISHYAIKEPLPAKKKELRSGEVRKLEIRIRKLVESIDDAKAIAAWEYRVEFEETVKDLTVLRDRLLENMFGDAVKKKESSESGSILNFIRNLGQKFSPSASLHNSPPPQDERYSNDIVGDQFTDAEYTKIKENQDLVKRVNTFLDIAETRLGEITRRMNKEEWKEKDPNPLEFYTIEQMVHAYERAITSCMINIDEKVKYKLADEKQTKKALEKLNKKINEFAPRLAPIRELAMNTKDQVLYKELVKAEKTTEIARKGSAYGLGAPVQ